MATYVFRCLANDDGMRQELGMPEAVSGPLVSPVIIFRFRNRIKITDEGSVEAAFNEADGILSENKFTDIKGLVLSKANKEEVDALIGEDTYHFTSIFSKYILLVQ